MGEAEGRNLHIGLRKMKSLLAIFVGFWVWQLIRLFLPELELHPIYIYIYGVLEMRETSEKTVDMGKNRLKTTFVALGVGLPVLFLAEFIKGFIQPQWLLITMDMAALLLGTLLVLCVAERVGCKTLCGLAAAIFIILLVAHSDSEPLTYSILRSAQTIIGLFIAWLINVKLFPYPGPVKRTQVKNNSPRELAAMDGLVTVTVDRPMGSYHPEYPDLYYPVNYGYISGILAGDGEEQDAYVLGVDRAVATFTGRVIAVVHRAEDVEQKWVVAPDGVTFTATEIRKQIDFQERYFTSDIQVL